MKTKQDALEALDYLQHSWQPKDGTAVFDEQCEDIRKALTENTWRDISTAPMDGTKILAFGGSQTDGNVYLIVYFDGYWRSKDSDFVVLTHWQPLPPKPEQPPC